MHGLRSDGKRLLAEWVAYAVMLAILLFAGLIQAGGL
jgi:hypothetical protein